ncbi:hypothetical protein TrLO_g8679 [Triparma laevis f. longispina]|uniref:SRCR domain-containing protein n=1 Tax=Triparma laevis f. longispina TaxID=1714387 RepID=A0A9W6Z9K9_9STRA|nr:hypothetical protein TrLO_g8679 [Triparma laevis f. longispina]
MASLPILARAQSTCPPGQHATFSTPTVDSALPSEDSCTSDKEYYLRLSTASGYSTPTFDENAEVEGRLEICHDEEWFSFRAYWYDFTDKDAQVACRQLGNQYDYDVTYSAPLSYYSTPDGNTNYGPYDLDCVGDEAAVSEVRPPQHAEHSMHLMLDN